jgi:hypothetical protein
MKKIKRKQERTPEEGNRLGNVHVALQFLTWIFITVKTQLSLRE